MKAKRKYSAESNVNAVHKMAHTVKYIDLDSPIALTIKSIKEVKNKADIAMFIYEGVFILTVSFVITGRINKNATKTPIMSLSGINCVLTTLNEYDSKS